MTDVRRPLSRSRLAVSAAVAVLAVIVACEAKRPAPLAPVTDYVLEDGATKVRRTLEGPILPAGEQRARFPLDAAIAQHFPGLAAKGGTDDPIFFVLDGENRILTAKIAPSPSGAPGAPTWDFDVKRESIDRVEVIKRGELLPQGVRGGVILITLKAGEGLSRSR